MSKFKANPKYRSQRRNPYPRQTGNSDGRTSWEPVSKWYNDLVGEKGQYFHQHVIIPGVLRLLKLKPDSSLLDLACGQGVLSRSIPSSVRYQGVDISPSLIDFAKKGNTCPNRHFTVGDITRKLPINYGEFSHAAVILALQNIEKADLIISNLRSYLKKEGVLVIVLNHPCFRIPRQSSWQTDEQNKIQYRRINRYLTPLSIPVNMHPGQSRSPVTWSYHQPLSYYFKILSDNRFMTQNIEEWSSDKESSGKAARMENRSRTEIPLFLANKSVYLP